MLSNSPRDRSRSPHSNNNNNNNNEAKQIHSTDHNDTSTETESTVPNRVKRDAESQQRTKSLKSFLQTLINDSIAIGSTFDEQMKTLENACIEEYRDLSIDRIRRVIRSVLKVRRTSSNQSSSTHSHTTNPYEHSNLASTNNDNNKNGVNSTTKASELVTSPTFDADFLRHTFSQQFRPSIDLSAYFAAAAASNGTSATSSLFRPNFSPSNFLQSLTSATPLVPPIPPPPPPPTLVSSHTNGTTDLSNMKSSKKNKLNNTETNTLRILVNAYREAASYLCRSADELEQLI